MNSNNEYNGASLLELAQQIMKKKRKPQTLDAIQKEVFEKAGLSLKETKMVAQFELDFMLSGAFVYCGVDQSNKNQLWDLKDRQPSSLLDKEGNWNDDPYADDEDVINNELKDDASYIDKDIDNYIEDDEEEAEVEDDDIQEELGLVADDEETQEIDASEFVNDDEEEEIIEDDEDLTEDIEKAKK